MPDLGWLPHVGQADRHRWLAPVTADRWLAPLTSDRWLAPLTCPAGGWPLVSSSSGSGQASGGNRLSSG